MREPHRAASAFGARFHAERESIVYLSAEAGDGGWQCISAAVEAGLDACLAASVFYFFLFEGGAVFSEGTRVVSHKN